MTVHNLKTWPEPFMSVFSNVKKFEIRKDDRGFNVGDSVLLCEWDPKSREYTGRMMKFPITYIGRGFGIPEDIVVLQLGCREVVDES